MKIDDLMKQHEIVSGTFNDLSKFNFKGVYIIYEESTKEVVYVGSCYTRKISDRHKQYTKFKDTGNTLMHAICKADYGIQKVKNIKSEDKKNAVDRIIKLKIKAIHYEDLEYQLIEQTQPKYNTVGIDKEED